MNKDSQETTENKDTTLIRKIATNPIFQGIIGATITLVIEYHTGIFQASQNASSYSISPIWSGLSVFTVIAFFGSIFNLLHISIYSSKYFREEFSLEAIFTIIWLTLALGLSLAGKIMVWHPVLAILYLLSNQKLDVPQPSSWEGHALLLLLLILLYQVASGRQKNWDGRKSIQQYQFEQNSESIDVFIEGIGQLKKIWRHEGDLEEYSASDSNQFINLEQSVDQISQSWMRQARELVRLSSSSYVIDEDSGWHDKQGCWVGQNVNIGTLFFLYPAQSILSNQDLDVFLNYSKEVAQSQDKQISEFIVAFQDRSDKLDTLKKLNTSINLFKEIKFKSEDDLLDSLVNFADYRIDIRKRVSFTKLPESDLTLNDVYVPSQLFTSEYEKADDDVEVYLRKWLDEPSQRQTALLGEYGQGKSSATLMFTYHLMCESDQLPKRIPILIELRGKSPRDLRPLELLGAWASQYRIDPQALMRLHVAGRLVLIFEGFDEMALIGNSELRLKHFKSLWSFCYPNAKIIITGRPNFFLDDKEMKTALGIMKPISDIPYCEAIRLVPFTVDQIQKALRAQKELVRAQICTLAKSETRFLDLISRPSLLHVVSVLWEKEELYKKTASLNSAYVMERFVRSSYRRQGLKAQGSKDFMALNSHERDYFMCGIASYMAAAQLSNQISNEQLNELINKLIDTIPDSVSTDVPEISNEDRRPLQQRIQTPDDIEHIKTDVRTCGLLVDDPSALGTFKFGHKSFMEYLFAKTVKEYIWSSDSEKSRAVKKVTSFPIESILDMTVSLGFLSEMIGTDPSTKQSTSSTNTSLRVATRLLNVIFSSSYNFFPQFFLYIFLSDYSYIESGKHYKPFKRFLIFSTSPIKVFSLFVGLVTLIIYYSNTELARSNTELARSNTELARNIEFTVRNNFAFIMLAYSSIFLSLIIYKKLLPESTKTSESGILRKLCLWNSLCKELQIHDQVLHQVARTSWLPWTRNQPFDYFLKESK